MKGEFLGVYSTVENRVLEGKPVVVKCNWYAWDWDGGTVAVQEVSPEWEFIGSSKIIVRAELESRFSFLQEEPPQKPTLPKAPEKGHRARTGIGDARTLDGILHLAEETARGDFASGVSALTLGDRQRAMFAFERPLEMEVPWRPRHKFMFSRFGVELRKLKIYGLALRHHIRAMELAPNDEHIWFNLARVHYAMGNWDKAMEYIQRVLDANPDLKEGRLFLEFLLKSKEKDPLQGPPLKMGQGV